MFQGFLPEPTVRQVQQLNNALQQVLTTYVPLRFSHGFDLRNSKLLTFSDSSLGNTAGKYSQGGYLVFLCSDSQTKLGGHMLLLSFRSAKSKRVANSTLAAELLAKTLELEEVTFIQTWLYELQNPTATPAEMIRLDSQALVPIDSCMDCNDLYDLLIKPGAPNITNKSLILHLSVVRSQKEEKKVRGWVWINTNDMLANPLTKLENDGCLDIELLNKTLKENWWCPKYVYKYENTDCVDNQ
jgi:hypothetical protein